MINHTIPKAAKLLGVSRTKVKSLIELNEIGSIIVGDKIYITQEQIDKYVEDAKTKKRYTIAKATEQLGISRYAMEGILEREEIVPVTINKRSYITQGQIDQFLANAKVDAVWKAPMERASDEEVVRKVNVELSKMGMMNLTAREEILVGILGRVLAN